MKSSKSGIKWSPDLYGSMDVHTTIGKRYRRYGTSQFERLLSCSTTQTSDQVVCWRLYFKVERHWEGGGRYSNPVLDWQCWVNTLHYKTWSIQKLCTHWISGLILSINTKDLKLPGWFAYDDRFKPSLSDHNFRHWGRKGPTAISTLTKNGNVMNFQELKTSYGLENRDHFRYLWLKWNSRQKAT